MSRKAIWNWKQRAAARRDFRAGHGDPEEPRGRHRRKRDGCKRSLDGEHAWGEPEPYNFKVADDDYGDLSDTIGQDLSYTIERCKLCRKKRWTFT